MMKKILSFILSICITSTMFSIYANAESTENDNLNWTFDEEGILIISGTGDMYNYSENNPAPWQNLLNKIDKVVIKDGVTSIGDYAFYPYTYSNLDITIPESLKKIGNNAFVEVVDEVNHWYFGRIDIIDYLGTPEDYKNIQIGTGNTGFEYGAIYYNKIKNPISGAYYDEDGNLSDIKWVLDTNGTLTVSGKGDIPWNKFIGLDNDNEYFERLVKEIIVEEGITGVANFGDFENLEKVTLPSTLKTISNSCFNSDVKLKNIDIPDNTEIIGEYAFVRTGIESIKIPESVKNIDTGIVIDTPLYNNEKNWTDGLLYIDNWLIDTKETLTGELKLRDGTVGIAGNTAKSGITSVILPKTIKYISDNTFSIYQGNEIIIPNGVLEIGSAFSWTKAKNIYIPKTVTHIDSYAFAYSNIENIYFDGSQNDWNKIFAYKDEKYEKPQKATFNFNAKTFSDTTAGESGTTIGKFTDVSENNWFGESVKYVFENNLMGGVSETEFSPSSKLTRAMLVTILYRAAGKPETDKSIPFADVTADSYYANAVIWAQQKGIVSGISQNEFAPDKNITREQIATIMFRFAKEKGYDVSVGENTNILSYTDAEDISEYAADAMQYAVGSGLITGKTKTTLNPKDTATRAEIAAILQRFIEGNK